MTLEEKIAYMQASVMEDARANNSSIVSSYRDALEKLFNDHKSESLLLSKTQIKSETVNARQQLNQASSKAHLDLKREESRLTQTLKDNIFKEVKALALEYMKTPEYEAYLVECIQGVIKIAGENDKTIYLNPTDAHLKASLEAKTGVPLNVSDTDFFGGIRTEIPARNILVDDSFETKLWNEYNDFLFLGGDSVA
ncbi:MAG: V-type ATP synthase subunit E [Ruminococcus sp.]|nr:V-type ATP synthase subunit E [Ruminococcus sp.]